MCRFPLRNSRYAGRSLINPGWTFGLALTWPNTACNTPYYNYGFSTPPFTRQTSSKRIWEDGNWLDARRNCCRACKVKVGIVNGMCSEKGRTNTPLHQLPKDEHHNRQGCQPNSGNGRVFGIVRRNSQKQKFPLLTISDVPPGWRQNKAYTTRWTLQVLTSAVLSEERPEPVPTRDVHYAINSHIIVCDHIPGECRHTLKIHRTTSGRSNDCTGITVKGRKII